MVRCLYEKCDFCGCCVAACPEDAIELKASSIHIDEGACVSCLSCVRVCPFGAIEAVE